MSSRPARVGARSRCRRHDVTYDLVSVQYHSLKAGHDYGQYVRDAKNADRPDIAEYFGQIMQQDSERAARCTSC
jgi:hypothetical protein